MDSVEYIAPPKIQVTRNYGMFVFLKENRRIIPRHVKALMKKIQKKNLLHLFPIIVNSKFEVIEGQHRLTAAEALGLAIYYIVDDNITAADIASVNTTRKSWTAKDYISHYANQGNASYIHLEKLISAYPRITVVGAIRLSTDNKGDYFGGGGDTEKMREGRIECIMSALAWNIAKTSAELNDIYEYAFDPFFMLNMKKAILGSKKNHSASCEMILSKKNMLPVQLGKLESCLPLLKEIVQ